MSPPILITGSHSQQITVRRPNSTPPTLAVLTSFPISQPSAASITGTIPTQNFPPYASPVMQPTNITQSTSPRIPTVSNAQFAVPVNHAVPNLSSWTFPVPSTRLQPIVTVPQSIMSPSPVIQTSLPNTNINAANAPVYPIQSGGTVFYCDPQPITVPPIVTTSIQHPIMNPLSEDLSVYVPCCSEVRHYPEQRNTQLNVVIGLFNCSSASSSTYSTRLRRATS